MRSEKLEVRSEELGVRSENFLQFWNLIPKL